MPRKSRIDAAGALQYIIARGIDRGKIFQDPADKYNFLDRLAEILKSTKTGCYAWALIPNHFHLLLRTGNAPIATVMRRLLTDHGLWSNRRHRRCGKYRQRVRTRSLPCYLASRESGISMAQLSRRMKLSVMAISYAVQRGEKIAAEYDFQRYYRSALTTS